MITIKEIAEMAGVHRATVDKVLHHRVGVSDEVRQRIQQIIDEVGYTPNPTGRALQKQGKTYRIAAVLMDVDAAPYLRQGIEQGAAGMAGFDITASCRLGPFGDVDRQCALIEQAMQDEADGILLSPLNSERIRRAIDRAAQRGIPVVTINTDIENCARVCHVGQNAKHASKVAGRLLGQFLGGRGKVAVVTSSIASENNDYYIRIRELGFGEFMAKHYPAIEIVDHVESLENKEITYRKMLELLRRQPDLNGLYITCGGVAEVGRALKESGRALEIKVLSHEDYPEILSLMQEEVVDCTLGSDLHAQGRNGLQLLMDRLIFGATPSPALQFTEIKILVKESLL